MNIILGLPSILSQAGSHTVDFKWRLKQIIYISGLWQNELKKRASLQARNAKKYLFVLISDMSEFQYGVLTNVLTNIISGSFFRWTYWLCVWSIFVRVVLRMNTGLSNKVRATICKTLFTWDRPRPNLCIYVASVPMSTLSDTSAILCGDRQRKPTYFGFPFLFRNP